MMGLHQPNNTTSSTETNPPVSLEVLPKGEVTVQVVEANTDAPGDLMTPWATSPAMAENQVVLTTGPGDKLAVSPTPSDQVGGEKQCILLWLLP